MSSITRDDKKNMLIRDIKKLESTRNLKPEFVKILKNKKKELEQITNEEDKEYLENLEKEDAIRQEKELAEAQQKQLIEENDAADIDKFKKASDLNKERYASENVNTNTNNTQTTASKRRTRRKKLKEDKAAKTIQSAFQTRKLREKSKRGIENLKQMKEIEKTYDAKRLEEEELEATKESLKENCSSLNVEPKILEEALLVLSLNADFLNQPNNSEILLKSYTDKLTSCGTDKVKQTLGQPAYENYRKNLREAYDIIDKIIKTNKQEAKARQEIEAQELKARQEIEAQELKAKSEAEMKANIPPACLSAEMEPLDFVSSCNVLGLNPNFINEVNPRTTFNKAYRKKMQICHTDKTGSTNIMKKISQHINEAKEIIKGELDKIDESRAKGEAEIEANRQAFRDEFSSKQTILDKCGNYIKGFKGISSSDVEKRAFEILEIKQEDFNIITNQQITRQILEDATNKAKQNLADCKKMNPIVYSNQNFKTALENIDGANYILNAIIQTKENKQRAETQSANGMELNAKQNYDKYIIGFEGAENLNERAFDILGLNKNFFDNNINDKSFKILDSAKAKAIENADIYAKTNLIKDTDKENAVTNIETAYEMLKSDFETKIAENGPQEAVASGLISVDNIQNTIKAIKISKYLFNIPFNNKKEYKKNLQTKFQNLYSRAENNITKDAIMYTKKVLENVLEWDPNIIQNTTEQNVQHFFKEVLPTNQQLPFLTLVKNALKYKTLSFEKSIIPKTRKNRQETCLELGKSRKLMLTRKAFPSQIKKLMNQNPFSIIQNKVQTREKEGKERETKAKETNEAKLKTEMQEQMIKLNQLKMTAQGYEKENLQNQINKLEAEIANIDPEMFTNPINYDFLKGKLSEINKLITRIEETRK